MNRNRRPQGEESLHQLSGRVGKEAPLRPQAAAMDLDQATAKGRFGRLDAAPDVPLALTQVCGGLLEFLATNRAVHSCVLPPLHAASSLSERYAKNYITVPRGFMIRRSIFRRTPEVQTRQANRNGDHLDER
jgi:hypothetical protein